ncbi:hypothetical protein ACCUM_0660 [Candidatus Accumulibacter phosphatis]|uniref:Uncharacterized protein n=1 Tax=Candidatus Accumulibacter phosphatis TaxID=327160 RepID=A0A5S4ETE7_9PROT|nr:hypothetical protein ACCUM_0660 [Candidatus Accumulibacter phosphatis]
MRCWWPKSPAYCSPASDAPGLDYDDAAEILLLLDRLAAAGR